MLCRTRAITFLLIGFVSKRCVVCCIRRVSEEVNDESSFTLKRRPRFRCRTAFIDLGKNIASFWWGVNV
jgi:hypothetical protein